MTHITDNAHLYEMAKTALSWIILQHCHYTDYTALHDNKNRNDAQLWYYSGISLEGLQKPTRTYVRAAGVPAKNQTNTSTSCHVFRSA
jgi:hypothetical protein